MSSKSQVRASAILADHTRLLGQEAKNLVADKQDPLADLDGRQTLLARHLERLTGGLGSLAADLAGEELVEQGWVGVHGVGRGSDRPGGGGNGFPPRPGGGGSFLSPLGGGGSFLPPPGGGGSFFNHGLLG